MKSSTSRYLVFLILTAGISCMAVSQTDALRNKIEQIAKRSAGRVGVAVIHTATGDTLTVNNHDRYPMQSVFKFPLAVAVLHHVDNGKLLLDQNIHVTKEDLLPNTWSPLREKYPEGNADLSLAELIRVTVAESDNNGCDILFRLVGGTAAVNEYFHGLGISRMEIVANEQDMHKDWNIQYTNWSSPFAMATVLYKFYCDSILSQKSRDYLWRVMVNTRTGPKRLKGKLPEGTVVGHKTGSSGTNEQGIAAATNDVGIVMLPDNVPVVVAVFVSDSKANEKEREEIIADIAKAVWDSYTIK